MKDVSAIRFLEDLCGQGDNLLSKARVAVVVAHPDDEAIGLASRLPQLKNAMFFHVTDGAPRNPSDAQREGFATREQYGRARREELYSGLALAGIPASQTHPLGLIDQEVSLNLMPLTNCLAELLRDFGVVITHPYEGGHPDHDSTAFAVHASCRLLQKHELPSPCIIEMTSYHARNQTIATSEFLSMDGGEVKTVFLSAEERIFKRRVLDSFRTQRETLRWFPIEVERFRLAPDYDFTRPPHSGRLFYEQFDWGMSGEPWRALVREALRLLEPDEKSGRLFNALTLQSCTAHQ